MFQVNSKKTKIVATIGPASESAEVIKKLILAGVNVFRLNFSHGKHADHLGRLQTIRAVSAELNAPVAILQDLQGPKIRVEEMQKTDGKDAGVMLEEGADFIITTEQGLVGDAKKASTSYLALIDDVKVGDRLMLDDGNIQLKAIAKTATEVHTKVIYGGKLKSRKGINLPDSTVSAPSLSDKDREDLEFGMDNGVDWVALSFVRRASDVDEMRAIIDARFPDPSDRPKIVSKVEKPEAVADIDAVIDASDAIMVARGDLGVEMEMQEVPIIQKMMVAKCNQKGKPVIVATQMLESMITSPRPTRAEAGDVANAVIDGADAVMLSAESASGMYPELAVKAMSLIIGEVEAKYPKIYYKYYPIDKTLKDYESDSVISSAVYLAEHTEAKAICALTSSGYTATQTARHRPNADIYVFSRKAKLLAQLCLVWGVHPIYYERHKDTDETIAELESKLLKDGMLKPGQKFLTLAAAPMQRKGRANMIKITTVRTEGGEGEM